MQSNYHFRCTEGSNPRWEFMKERFEEKKERKTFYTKKKRKQGLDKKRKTQEKKKTRFGPRKSKIQEKKENTQTNKKISKKTRSNFFSFINSNLCL